MVFTPGLNVRIVTHEGAHVGGRSMIDALIILVRREGLAGITVTRAAEDYSDLHGTRSQVLADLSDDLPLNIDIVDSVERIEHVLPQIAALVEAGALTVTRVRISSPYARRISSQEHTV